MWVAYHPLPDWRTGGLPSSLMPESVCFPKGRMCGGVFLQEGQVRFFPPYRSVANQSVVCRCIWRLWTKQFFQMQSVEHYIWMPTPDDSSSSFFFLGKKASRHASGSEVTPRPQMDSSKRGNEPLLYDGHIYSMHSTSLLVFDPPDFSLPGFQVFSSCGSGPNYKSLGCLMFQKCWEFDFL